MNLYPFEDAWNGLLMKDEVISQAKNWTQIFLKMDSITPDNMVKKKVFKQGLRKDGRAPEDCTVVFNVIMFVDAHDQPIDNSLLRGKPQKVDLGKGNLCEGLEIALTSMRKREISLIAINWRYGYGERGAPPRIPGKARIIVAVELLDFYKIGTADHLINALPEGDEHHFVEKMVQFRQVHRQALKCYKKGIRSYREGEWYAASKLYDQGCDLLTKYRLKDEKEQAKQERLLVKLYLNLAASSIKINRPTVACTVCREVLFMRPGHIKAMYRFGIAKLMLEDVETALGLFQQILEVRPDDHRVRKRYDEAWDEFHRMNRIGMTESEDKWNYWDVSFETEDAEDDLIEDAEDDYTDNEGVTSEAEDSDVDDAGNHQNGKD